MRFPWSKQKPQPNKNTDIVPSNGKGPLIKDKDDKWYKNSGLAAAGVGAAAAAGLFFLPQAFVSSVSGSLFGWLPEDMQKPAAGVSSLLCCCSCCLCILLVVFMSFKGQ